MPQSLKLYIGFVVTAGFLLFLAVLFNIAWTETLWMVSVIGIISGILDRYLLILPNDNYYSLSMVFTIYALFAFGPWEAVYVEIIACLLSQASLKMNGIKFLFNMAQYMLSAFAAGIITYSFMEETLGEVWLFLLLGVPTAVIVYQLVNVLLVANVLRMGERETYLSVVLSLIKDASTSSIINVGISMFLIYLYPAMRTVDFFLILVFIAVVMLILRFAFSKFLHLRKTYVHTLERLATMKESHSGRDSGHANRVGSISRALATSLKLSQEAVDEIHYAALLHDIGKEYISPHLFRKSTSFTIEEEKEYQRHVDVGADVIKEITGLPHAADFVYYHHENWDGSGYPKGLHKEEIPLGARIIRLANEYDHIMKSDFVRNKKESFLNKCFTILDPTLAEHFLATFDFDSMHHHERGEGKESLIFEDSFLDQAKKRYEDSVLLEHFGMYQSVTFKDGEFRDHMEREVVIPMAESVKNILEEHPSAMKNYHEFLEDKNTGKVYDVHFAKMGADTHVLLFDVTHILAYEKQQEERIRALYRDVIHAVTQGKLLLQEGHELDYEQGDKLFEIAIEEKEDVGKARNAFAESAASFILSKKDVYSMKLCLSEVATNVLKHAEKGWAKAYKDEDILRIVVSDVGDGIALEDLPKSALFAGYSSRKSLGHGYHLLLKFADQVLLSTNGDGTVVVIEKNLEPSADNHLLNFEQNTLI